MKKVLLALIPLFAVNASAAEFRCEVSHSNLFAGNGTKKTEFYNRDITVTRSKTTEVFALGYEGGASVKFAVSLLDGGQMSLVEEKGSTTKLTQKVSVNSFSQIVSFESSVDSPTSVNFKVRCGLKEILEQIPSQN
ncbi:MAG: hypothetical protein JNL01_03815 [Bdellovibrionales bacterium]|nr:hypothetical protein [Bdellovibrionales bacterium]